jgi:PAS domain S-box-containing protein
LNLTLEDYIDNPLAFAILSSLSDTIILADHTSDIILCNKQLSGLVGYESSDLVGKPLESLWVCPKECTKLLEKLSLKKRARVEGIEVKLLTKTHSERIALFCGSAVCTTRGRLVGFVCSLHDITYIRR